MALLGHVHKELQRGWKCKHVTKYASDEEEE